MPARSLRPLPGLLLFSLLLASRAAAQPVAVRCERLGPERRDELRARIRLVLRSATKSALPSALAVECSERSATLVWKAAFSERMRIDETPGLVEGTLDAIEARLAQVGRPLPKKRRPPRRQPPPPPPAAPAASPRAGGAGLGMSLEALPGPLTAGPRLDLAAPLGPVSFVAVPSLRAAPDGSLLFSSEAGVAFGAPYWSDLPVGAIATLGVEALSATSARGGPESHRWSVAPGGSIGLRGGLRLDRATFWIGVDAHRRFEPLHIQAPDVELARSTILFSVGCLFGIDLSERKRVH